MSRRRRAASSIFCLAALVSLAAASAQAGRSADPGITSRSILLGGTIPLTGPFASVAGVARGAEAYFKYLNGRGGVNGRTITYKYYDDAYDPVQTFQLTRQLVQQDRVFAVFNTVGTEHNLAIRSFLNEVGVPHLFLATGLSAWGLQYKQYPWTMGFLPSYVAEGIIYGKYIAKTRPKAKIAILYQDDDYGKDMIAGLRRGLGKRASQIIAREGYGIQETDVSAQIARLKAKQADTLMVFAFGKFAIQAFHALNRLGWKPVVFVNQVASSVSVMQVASGYGSNKRTDGALSIGFIKDPADPRWRNDPGMKLYLKIMGQHLSGANVKDGYHTYGMAVAFTMADALRRAGREPTRQGLMRAATSLNQRNNPFVLPGISVRTKANDRFPVTQAQLQRYSNKGRWIPFGGVISARG